MQFEEDKLCLRNLPEHQSDEEVRAMCEQFGRVVSFIRPKTRTLAFPTFESASVAKQALKQLDEMGICVSIAIAQNSSKEINKRSVSFPLDKMSEYGECVLCMKKTDYRCARCYAFYCSIQCQLEDSSRHRLICYRLPCLVQLKKTSDTIPSTSQQVKKHEIPPSAMITNNQKVIVSHVCNNFQVYVRPTALATDYRKLLQNVSESAPKSERLMKMPIIGDSVLAPFKGSYFRALVKKVDTAIDVIKVCFWDLGNEEMMLLYDLRELRDDLKIHPRYIVKVTLKNVEQDKTNTDAVNYLKQFVDQTALLIKCDENEIKLNSVVELCNPHTNEVINEVATKLIVAKKPTHNNEDAAVANGVVEEMKAFTANNSKKKSYTGNNKRLRVVDNSLLKDQKNLITCIDHADTKKFAQFLNQIQEYGEQVSNAPAYVPSENEMCLIKVIEEDYVTAWYRGELQMESYDAKKQQAYAVLIDAGKIVLVDFKDIRQLPSELSFPEFSLVCKIAGYDEELNDSSTKKLMQIFKTFEEVTVLSIERIDDDGQFFYILHIQSD